MLMSGKLSYINKQNLEEWTASTVLVFIYFGTVYPFTN